MRVEYSIRGRVSDRHSRAVRYRMDRFNDSQMLQLAEIYRDYECLWNVNNALYKNRPTRECVYQEIADKLNIPGVSAKDIPKKIKNLRSSYYQELKKIDKSIQSGADQDSVYTPKVSWFALVDELLSAIRNKQETFLNIDDNSKTSDNDSDTCNIQSVENIKVEEISNPSDDDIEDDNFTETNNIGAASSSRFAVPYKKPLKHREQISKKDEDINKAIAKIDKIANRITGRSNSRIEKQEDEFDVYGKYIAIVLRSLPGELAVRAKLNLQKSLSDFQLSAMKERKD